MTKTKHTPGPWEPYQDGIRASNGEIIATVHHVDADTGKFYGMGESDATARLIAKAPELLAMVQDFADTAYSTKPEYFDRLRVLESEARALLAEIDGGTS
jgi:hypothetical protein